MLSLMISIRDVGIGDQAMQHLRQAGGVALDLEVEEGDLAAGAIEDDDVRLADGDAGDVDAAGGADDRVGDRRVGHQDVAGVARQVDDDRLVEADLDGAMDGAGCHRRRHILRAGGGERDIGCGDGDQRQLPRRPSDGGVLAPSSQFPGCSPRVPFA